MNISLRTRTHLHRLELQVDATYDDLIRLIMRLGSQIIHMNEISLYRDNFDGIPLNVAVTGVMLKDIGITDGTQLFLTIPSHTFSSVSDTTTEIVKNTGLYRKAGMIIHFRYALLTSCISTLLTKRN